MKLAEALVQRADCNRRMQELRERMMRNAQYQDGEQPAEDPSELLEEYLGAEAQLQALIVKINRKNQAITLDNGQSMLEALAERDTLKARHDVYKTLAEKATPKQDRYSKTEIKFISAVNVKDIQTLADETAKAYRELDSRVQQANWLNELD